MGHLSGLVSPGTFVRKGCRLRSGKFDYLVRVVKKVEPMDFFSLTFPWLVFLFGGVLAALKAAKPPPHQTMSLVGFGGGKNM